MGIRYAKQSKLWRIQIQKGGSRVSTTAASKAEADALYSQLRSDLGVMHRRKTGALDYIATDPAAQSEWEKAITAAAADEKSWLRQRPLSLKRRHNKRDASGPCLSFDELRDLYLASHGRCAISGVRLELPGNGKAKPTTASIDRIKSEYGYLLPNCRVVALCVNVAMSTWGEELFRKLCYGVVAREYL